MENNNFFWNENEKNYFVDLPTSKLYINNDEISEERMRENLSNYRDAISFYREYPDKLIDDMFVEYDEKGKPTFRFYPVQRIMLRVFARYRYVFATFNRGFSKSFMGILFQVITCILYPRTNLFLVAGTAEQGAKIGADKLEELLTLFPRLKNEVVCTTKGKYYAEGRDNIKMIFKNGSSFELVAALQSNRGRRKHGGIVEECVLIDGQKLSEVIIPMMNVPRKVNGEIDPNEVHKRQLFVTSAGYKNTFSYDKLLQILIWQAIKDDGTAFCLGGSWELPVKMGLLEKTFVDELKEDGTYNEATFEREYGSLWGGASEDSFFNGDQIDKSRTLKQPTLHSEMKNNPKIGAYYIVSADVGRLGCDTVACVFKVYPNSNGASLKHLVYMEVYSEEHFEIQAFHLKDLVDKYNARILVVDANGNGVGLVDFLVLESHNIDRTRSHPPYSVVNDDRYNKYKTEQSKPLLYNIKGNAELNNEIAVNVASQFSSGKIKLLIDERIAKSNLTIFEEKNNKRYSVVERARILRPYILTSSLKEEILNLKSKLTENKKAVTLVRDNNKIEKDKYSAFSYGLYWIKLQDDSKISRKRLSRFKDFMMYTRNER